MTTPTIRKVAALAGVSTATVSRTLSHPDRVSDATREKVLEAVRATGFVPNRQAVNFRRRATGNVVLLVRDISNPFYLDIYRGVEEHAFANGYRVLMGDGFDDDRIAGYVDMVRNRQADGLILMTGRVPESLRSTKLPPIVVALETIEGMALPTVEIDNRAAARLAVEHLIALGHRRIAHVTGPMQLVMARERHAGYLDALAAAGIAADPALTVYGDFHFATGQDAVRQLLKGASPVSAVFLSNDEMAAGAVTALRAEGVRVPADISIVGFDDVVFAEAADPPLTTMRQPRREIGRASMAMMIDTLDGKPVESRRLVDVELVRRASSAPPAVLTNRARSA